MLQEKVFTDNASSVLFLVGNLDRVDRSYATQIDHTLFVLKQFGTGPNMLFETFIKSKYYSVYPNGIIIRSRRIMSRYDIEPVHVFCNYQDFSVLVNEKGTATIFARNVTSMPKT